MGKLIGRIFRIFAWLAPIYQFRVSLWRKSGVKIGKRVYIGNLVFFDGEYPHLITLGDDSSIGPLAIIIAHSSASPYHQQTGIYGEPPKPVHIQKGAWIGSGAIILPGVTIGVGSIVAAGAVVSKNVPNFTLAAGNPARVIKRIKLPRKD